VVHTSADPLAVIQFQQLEVSTVVWYYPLNCEIHTHTHTHTHTSHQKLYLAFVRNCKFTSASSLPRIRFMRNCLVELLTIDPPITYQHGFVYLRQLALHLRTAMTSGKKEGQQVSGERQQVRGRGLAASHF